MRLMRRIIWIPTVLFVVGLAFPRQLPHAESAAPASASSATKAGPSETGSPLSGNQIDFERDVMPVLTRFGCNSGPCHGKARGQNGFQLSLLGFDPNFDHAALTKEGRGRRVFPPNPEVSLLLTKPTGESPHGGGKRLEKGSPEYKILRDWIASGGSRGIPGTPVLTNVVVEPSELVLDMNSTLKLKVTAHYADGSKRDVTRLAQFQSNESAVASVDDHGQVKTSTVVGDAAVMSRYLGRISICQILVPRKEKLPDSLYAKLPRKNFIDEHVWAKLKRMGIAPSPSAEDHTFLRRAYLDIIGRPPTADEARKFLADKSPNKRDALVDYLLEQPEYADFWANKWADLLRPNAYHVGIKATMVYDQWIRESFRQNKPYDQFVREIITASGSTFRNGNVVFYRDRRAPVELTTIASQLFLGIRLDCAKCHHHPFEIWGQDEFYGFAAYFSKIGRKGVGISAPISGSEEIVFSGKSGAVTHPLTGATMTPKPLFGTAREVGPEDDPREALADWIVSKDNKFFVQVQANRVWADMMGRGIVEPVDDLRGTNPPSNPALLEALGEDFRANGHDIKKLIRRIATSYVYGLSSLPNDTNIVDTRNYSRHYRDRLRAEVLLDAASQITGVPETYAAMPTGSRATEIWSHRIASLFLDAFGRPDPNQDPPCERTSDTSVVQVLHLMNAEQLHNRVTSASGKAAQLANSKMTSEQIIDELYLNVYSRYPDDEEKKIGLSVFNKVGATRRQATEDLMWAMLNTAEFVFKN